MMKLYRRIALAILAAAGLSALLWPVIVSNMQLFGTLPNEAEICSPYRTNGYCSAEWYEDGAVRLTVSSTSMANCCEIERFNLDDQQVNYRMIACDKSSGSKVSCEKFEGSKNYYDIFYIDGKVLSRMEEEEKSND